MDQYGYGGRANPYAQQEEPAGGGYGAPPPRQAPPGAFGQGPRPGGGAPRYDGPASPGGGEEYGAGGYGGNNVEMAPLAHNGAGFAQGDPNAILNECREIGDGIKQIDNALDQLRMLQDRSLNEADNAASATSRQLDALSSETMAMYRELTERVRQLKSQPDANQPKNAPQVGRIDRSLKEAIQKYQQVESAFRKKTQDQMARQYRIVRPDADENEVRAAVEDVSGQGSQVFQQAMMQSSRQGQARAVLNAVQDRHQALQRIEQQMIELAQLFQDMDTLVIQQEAAVVQIEQKGEEVVENLDKGNQEIEVAVTTARKTRKKKWICLGVCILIIVVIVVIVVVYMMITKQNNTTTSTNTNTKRSTVEFAGERPVTTIYAQSKIAVPGLEWKSDTELASAPLARFAGANRGKSLAGRFVVPNKEWTSDAETAVKEKRWVVANQDYVPQDTTSAAKEKRWVVANQDYVPEDTSSAAKERRWVQTMTAVAPEDIDTTSD